jgi:hypothetical protein
MSSKDKLEEQLLRTQPYNATQRMIEEVIRASRPNTATQWLIDHAGEAQRAHNALQQLINSQILTNSQVLKDYNAVGRLAAEAASKIATSNVQIAIEALTRLPKIPSYFGDIQKLFVPALSDQYAEAMRMNAITASASSQAVAALIESADSMRRIGAERVFEALSAQTINIPHGFLNGMAESAALAAFKQIQPQIPGIFDEIRTTFAGTIAEAIRHALEERDEESFNRVEKLITDKFASLPQNSVAPEAFWKTFLAILSLLIAFGSFGTDVYQAIRTHESSISQPAQDQQIADLLKQIAINTTPPDSDKDENTYYIVERKVSVQIKPTFKSPTIAILFPNQKVRLVQDKHKWIYIEYFDYLESIPRYGWANKKYLKRLEGSPGERLRELYGVVKSYVRDESSDEEARARKLEAVSESLLERHKRVYEELAKGAE